MGLVFYDRLEGFRQLSPFSLGIYEVNLCQEMVGVDDLRHVRAHLIGKYRQDADDLAPFFGFQLAHLVVGFHHFSRFDEYGLSSSRLIVHDTIDAALHRGSYRQH